MDELIARIDALCKTAGRNNMTIAMIEEEYTSNKQDRLAFCKQDRHLN